MCGWRHGSIPPGVERLAFSTRTHAAYSLGQDYLVGPDGTKLMPVADLPRALPHDVANSLAAAAVALAAGATVAGCRAALGSTPPLPHRVGFVAEGMGISWYDDSKATTPASVLAAVAGFPSVVLIAGGRNKGIDLGALAAAVPPVRAVIAIGEAAGEIEHAFARLVPVAIAGSMSAAVDAAKAWPDPGTPSCCLPVAPASTGTRRTPHVATTSWRSSRRRWRKGKASADNRCRAGMKPVPFRSRTQADQCTFRGRTGGVEASGCSCSWWPSCA